MDGDFLKGGMYVPSLKNRKKKVCWFESALNSLSSCTTLQALNSNNNIMKQMIQIEHNRITNPNGREAAPVGYLQAWPRI